MAQDSIDVEILPDGTLKITTDPISAPNHKNASELLDFIAQLAGGKTTRTRRGHHAHHGHQHKHEHETH